MNEVQKIKNDLIIMADFAEELPHDAGAIVKDGKVYGWFVVAPI